MAKNKVKLTAEVTEKMVEKEVEEYNKSMHIQVEQKEDEQKPEEAEKKERKAPEEHAVKTEHEKMSELLNNPFQRVYAEQQAARLYMMVTGETDLQKCDEKIITEMDVCKKTTLSHKQANNLFDVFQIFGIIEFTAPRTFKFIFSKERHLETILMGIGATLNILKTDIIRFMAVLEAKKVDENKNETPEFTEDQIKAYKMRLRSMVKYALK